MNDSKRKRLKKAAEYLECASSVVESVMDQEQDALDNIPENLQYSDRCSDMESAIDLMQDALDNIETAKEKIDSAL